MHFICFESCLGTLVPPACNIAATELREAARAMFNTTFRSMLFMFFDTIKINSYICVNLYKIYVNKKEKHLASPYVYVNLMQQGCQIKLIFWY